MQPGGQSCPACGVLEVDPSGFCAGCRAYRGLPGPPAAAPQYPPAQQYPPVQQYPPAPHHPATPQYPPAQQYPPTPQYQPAPQYQQQPPQYQQAQPVALQPAPVVTPSPGRNRTVMTAVIAGATIVAVGAVIAITVGALRDSPGVIADPQPSATTATPTAPAAAGSGAIDQCVIGTWRETAKSIQRRYGSVQVTLTSSGAHQAFTPEGVIVLNFGPGVTATGTAAGKRYEVFNVGKLTWNYSTKDGMINYTDPSGSIEVVTKIDGQETDRRQEPAAALPAESYTCSGDTMQQFGTGYSITLTRVSTAT